LFINIWICIIFSYDASRIQKFITAIQSLLSFRALEDEQVPILEKDEGIKAGTVILSILCMFYFINIHLLVLIFS